MRGLSAAAESRAAVKKGHQRFITPICTVPTHRMIGRLSKTVTSAFHASARFTGQQMAIQTLSTKRLSVDTKMDKRDYHRMSAS